MPLLIAFEVAVLGYVFYAVIRWAIAEAIEEDQCRVDELHAATVRILESTDG